MYDLLPEPDDPDRQEFLELVDTLLERICPREFLPSDNPALFERDECGRNFQYFST